MWENPLKNVGGMDTKHRYKLFTFKCDIDLEPNLLHMASEHWLNKPNVRAKFNEEYCKNVIDREQKPNANSNILTFKCDLEIEPKQLTYAFCTPSQSA